MNYAPKPPNEYLQRLPPTLIDGFESLCADQAKFNFAWLAFPELDTRDITCLPQDFVMSVHEHMDATTRRHLGMLPLQFVRYWGDLLDKIFPALCVCMPEDHFARMTLQAHKAQARIVVRRGNVIIPPFGRAA